ncbi:MAG: hypothetical protein HND57_05045 [Planctomycetes bacterium]|nr:hypothetical protein [Planctomycetota bacterium]
MHEKGIQLIGLSGALEGVRYRLSGQFGPLLHTDGETPKLMIPDFDLWFKVDEFDLQRDLTVLAAVPQPQRSWIERQLKDAVTLQGIIDADIHLYRNVLKTDLQQEGSYLSALWGQDEWLSTGRFQTLPSFEAPRPVQEDSPLGFDGRITIKTASGLVSAFPYPLTGIMGTIWFDAQGVEITDLAASGPDGEGIIMSGRIEHLGPTPEIDLDIVAANVPIEGHLKDALGARNGKAINMVMHEPSATALHEAGAFITPDDVEELGDELLRIISSLNSDEHTDRERQALEDTRAALEQRLYKPVFALGGRVNITTHVTREAGPGNPTIAETTVRLSRTGRSIGLMYKEFPYPVYLIAGEMRIGYGAASKSPRISSWQGRPEPGHSSQGISTGCASRNDVLSRISI